MTDWKGLFDWSMKYNDGTKPSNASKMTEGNKQWLEKVMKEYTYDDADRMQQICKRLYEDI